MSVRRGIDEAVLIPRHAAVPRSRSPKRRARHAQIEPCGEDETPAVAGHGVQSFPGRSVHRVQVCACLPRRAAIGGGPRVKVAVRMRDGGHRDGGVRRRDPRPASHAQRELIEVCDLDRRRKDPAVCRDGMEDGGPLSKRDMHMSIRSDGDLRLEAAPQFS